MADMVVAIHEAGHAVVALRLRIKFEVLVISPPDFPEWDGLGGMTSYCAGESSWEDQVVLTLAGHAAALRYSKTASGQEQDEQEAAELIAQNCPETRRSEAEQHLRQKANDMVEKDWPAIVAVAEAAFCSDQGQLWYESVASIVQETDLNRQAGNPKSE